MINCSNKVEVMDARTGIRIGQVEIPNCRYVRFHRGYAYITSYVAGVQIDPNAPLGAVFKVDTTNLQIIDKVSVGYQPDELWYLEITFTWQTPGVTVCHIMTILFQ